MRLLYFSPVAWQSYYQRPHYMAKYFLGLDSGVREILWVNPYPNRLPRWQDFFHKRPRAEKTSPLLQGLKTISPRALPVEPVLYSEYINDLLFWQNIWPVFKNFKPDIIGIGRPSKLALLALAKISCQWSFYDAMDDFPMFYRGLSRYAMTECEKKIAKRVDKLFVSSTVLQQKFSSPYAAKITVVHNAYDMQSLPEINLASKKPEKITFGYVGSIGIWFDWNIVFKLARAFPDAIVKLIGPCFVPPPANMPVNIELLPECPQPEVVAHILHFSAGLIPFKQNSLTQGVDPIKYYEYRACGLPVLSTRFGEVLYKSDPHIYFMDENTDFNVLLQKINFSPSFDRTCDWQQRFALCGF